MATAEELVTLHAQGYSKLPEYYTHLTQTLHGVRSQILDYVLLGKDQTIPAVKSIGPVTLEGTLEPLEQQCRILDMGCGVGDNLQVMKEKGFHNLTGVDIAGGMIKEASRVDAELICADLFNYQPTQPYDLVFAQAFVHLFPKKQLRAVLTRCLELSRRRFYFSTTIHDTPKEGLENKGEVTRYRSRYTTHELLDTVAELLAEDPNLSFTYHFLTDPLGKYWINGVFERVDSAALFEREGLLTYRQFVSTEKAASFLPELRAMAEETPSPGTLLRYDSDTGFDRVENFLSYCSKDLKALLIGPRIDNLVATCIREPAVLLKDKINYKIPGSGAFPPHQDAAAGWERYGNRLLSLAFSFDDSTASNGALFFAPGAHRKGLLGPLKSPLSDEAISTLTWRQVELEAGDLVLFDAYTPHYSEANTSAAPRRMAFLTYNDRRHGDYNINFFHDKRQRQPPIDERKKGAQMIRDAFGKLVYE